MRCIALILLVFGIMLALHKNVCFAVRQLAVISLKGRSRHPQYPFLSSMILHTAVSKHDLARISSRSYSVSLKSTAKEENLDPAVRAKDVVVPLDKIEFNFARSSGPGGQNVNKLNTKAEMRFHVQSASWIAPEVRQRLIQYNANKITKEGELYISSQEHRTQAKNKDDCVTKLQELIAEAMLTPKEREMWVGLSEKTKQNRKDEKRKRGDVKNNRKKVKDFD